MLPLASSRSPSSRLLSAPTRSAASTLHSRPCATPHDRHPRMAPLCVSPLTARRLSFAGLALCALLAAALFRPALSRASLPVARGRALEEDDERAGSSDDGGYTDRLRSQGKLRAHWSVEGEDEVNGDSSHDDRDDDGDDHDDDGDDHGDSNGGDDGDDHSHDHDRSGLSSSPSVPFPTTPSGPAASPPPPTFPSLTCAPGSGHCEFAGTAGTSTTTRAVAARCAASAAPGRAAGTSAESPTAAASPPPAAAKAAATSDSPAHSSTPTPTVLLLGRRTPTWPS
ncbi:unnamed protein product [Closterium sp. NIES-53]